MLDANALKTRAKGALSDYLAALRRRPTGMLALTVGMAGLPIINAHGVAAFTGMPLLLSLPVGGWMLAKQVEAFIDWRERRTSRLVAGPTLAAISGINMIFVAAGLAAWDEDRLGAQMIARQTEVIVAQADVAAAQLEAAADIANELATYSSQRARVEGAENVADYAPTCPASTGNKPGPISRWRDSTAASAAQDATRLSDAARRARTAAEAADGARKAYEAAKHAEAMRAIGTQVGSINAATASIRDEAMVARLEQLVRETDAGGICPDAPLNDMGRKLLAAASAQREPLTFKRLDEPDETVAVQDLLTQLARIPTGNADLNPYFSYLALSPLIDFILMSSLAGMWGKVTRNLHREALQRHGLRDDVTEVRLLAARQAAAQDLRWLALATTTKQRRRLWTKETVAIAEEDAVALAEAEDLVASKQWRLTGRDDEGRFVFALRPDYRKTLWRTLVRDHLESIPPGDGPVVLTVVEGTA